MLVPSANNIFVDLSVVAKVTPVPDAVLNSTVKTPTVPFSIIYVFSVVSGIVTTIFPVIVPVNLITAFLPLDIVASVIANVVVPVPFTVTASYPAKPCCINCKFVCFIAPCSRVFPC
jgi:hypothetical protein